MSREVGWTSLFILNEIAEWERLDGSNFRSFSSGSSQHVTVFGELRSSLQVNLVSRLARFVLGSFVLLLASQNFLLALGLSDMLDTDMNTFLNDTSIDELVYTYTNRRLGNVENNSCTSMISLVGHTLMNSGVGKDVDIITDLDFHQVLRQMNGTMLTVLLGEHMARTRPESKGVRHGVSSLVVTGKSKIWNE